MYVREKTSDWFAIQLQKNEHSEPDIAPEGAQVGALLQLFVETSSGRKITRQISENEQTANEFNILMKRRDEYKSI